MICQSVRPFWQKFIHLFSCFFSFLLPFILRFGNVTNNLRCKTRMQQPFFLLIVVVPRIEMNTFCIDCFIFQWSFVFHRTSKLSFNFGVFFFFAKAFSFVKLVRWTKIRIVTIRFHSLSAEKCHRNIKLINNFCCFFYAYQQNNDGNDGDQALTRA